MSITTVLRESVKLWAQVESAMRWPNRPGVLHRRIYDSARAFHGLYMYRFRKARLLKQA